MTAPKETPASETPVVEPVETPASETSTSSTTETPLLTVTKGNPSAEELAAVTAVVLALQSSDEPEPKHPVTRQWARRAQLNLAPKPGPGAWRRSRS